MFKIFIKDFKRPNGTIESSETLLQSIPASSESMLKLISPVVKGDMGNAESFEFSIEGGTQYCDSFLQMRTYLRVEYDGTTIFMGRVLTVNCGFRGTRKVRCEGPLAFFNDTPFPGEKEEDRKTRTVYEYMSRVIDNHNSYAHDSRRSFTLGEVPGHYSGAASEQQLPNTERKYGQDGWTDTKSALEDLRSHYGGYYRVRFGNNFHIGDPIVLDWMDHYFNATDPSNNQTVEVGKNILDINNDSEVDNIFTAIIPIGNDVDNKNTQHFYLDGSGYVTVPEICNHFSQADLNRGYHRYEDYRDAISKYGYIFKTVNFDESTTKEKLYNDACEWIRNNYQGEVPKFSVKAIDMHQIGSDGNSIPKIMVGDRVRIIYPVVDENGVVSKRTTDQTCINISYDLYNPENNNYTFGIPANIMTKTYGLKKQTKSKTGNTAAASEPKNEPTPAASRGGEASWLQKMKNWLMHHKVHYEGEKPYTEGKAGQTGPYATDSCTPQERATSSLHYFYQVGTGIFGVLTNNTNYLWKATKDGNWLTPEKYQFYRELYVKSIDAAESFRRANITTHWTLSLERISGLTAGIICDFNLPEYIKDEYGIDLMNGSQLGGTKIPTDVELPDGGVLTTLFDENNEPITQLSIDRNGKHITVDMTDCKYTIVKDIDGVIHYYVMDENGKFVETINPRNLELEVADSANFKGWLVRNGYADVIGDFVGQKYEYKFGIGIENNELKDGRQLVVARVDGDVVRIGSTRTEVSTVIAHQFSGNWVAPYTVIRDSTGKAIGMTFIDQAGTKNYKGRFDPVTGDFIEDPNGTISFTASGIWDGTDLRFKGGIVTGTTDTGEVVSYVKSNRLVIGDYATDLKVKDALYDSGLISDDEYGQAVANALVAEEVYTKKLNSVDASIKNLQTYKLTTSELDSKISDLAVVHVKTIQAAKGTTNATLALHTVSALERLYIGTEADTIDLISNGIRDSVIDLQVARVSGTNTYEISKKTIASHTEWTVVGSFDVATSLLGNWSGSTSLPVLTVQDQAPVPHTYKIGFGENTKVDRRLDVTGNGTPAAYTNDEGKVVEKYLNVPIKVFEIDPPSGGNPPSLITRYSKTMTGVDGTVVYDQGWAKCYTSKSVITTGSSGNLGYGSQGSAKVTIKAGPNDKTATTLLDISWVAPGDNSASGYSSCWRSYRSAATRDSGILDPGQSAGVAIYMKDSSGTERLRDNWYWTAKSVSIDIPSSQISTTQYWDSSCTELTKLRNACNDAKKNGDNLKFRVDAGGVSKWYIMDFS